jgi:predicted lipoprotein with Yx(FWY)xxD motif
MRFLAPLLVSALLLAGSAALAASGPAKLEKTSLGTVLADAHGMTLYTFEKDGHDESNCVDKCAVNWPPFAAPADAKESGHWSMVSRADGTKQWAYKGKPLYTWSKDHKPGETTGNGFLNGAWQVARP